MNNVIAGLKSNWHLMRVLRMVFGIFMLVSFIKGGDTIALLIGAFLLYQAIFNVGCANGGTCYTAGDKTDGEIEDVAFEEIKKP